MSRDAASVTMDKAADLDRRLVLATQSGLPLVARPYHWLADELGIPVDTLMARFRAMLDDGRIRRIGVVPNHYRLGYVANGMSVWDVVDEEIADIGHRVGELDIVSHCYHRPRQLPDWPYNLFAMVHGHSQAEVRDKVKQIADLLGDRVRQYDVLFSNRILKKTGLRFAGG